MLKEIHEQPDIFRKNIQEYIREDDFTLLKDYNLRRILLNKTRYYFQASGTSLHAGFVGRLWLEKTAKVLTDADFSSEFRYREPLLSKDTLVVAITQSGETADTIAGIRLAKEQGVDVLSIVNVKDSTVARESDYVIYINAGPEIGVASTKAYTAQLLVLLLLSLELAALKGYLSDEKRKEIIKEIRKLPELAERVLRYDEEISDIAEEYKNSKNFMFLGRGYNYPTALEAALKLKEISYIHATGYAAGEMKHGPIALVDKDLPVCFILPQDSVYDKTKNNLLEIRSRGGKIIAVATEDDNSIKDLADHVIYIPKVPEILEPIIAIIPLQLLAYHIAVKRGCDVDKPRNLAKSVTVE